MHNKSDMDEMNHDPIRIHLIKKLNEKRENCTKCEETSTLIHMKYLDIEIFVMRSCSIFWYPRRKLVFVCGTYDKARASAVTVLFKRRKNEEKIMARALFSSIDLYGITTATSLRSSWRWVRCSTTSSYFIFIWCSSFVSSSFWHKISSWGK